MRRYLFFLIGIIILVPLISAFDVSKFDYEYKIPINYSLVGTVNASEWWITDEDNLNNIPDLYPTLDLRYLQTELDPLSLHLNQDNFGFADDWIYYSNPDFYFNSSKLSTQYFNATSIEVVTGTGAGNLIDIQSYNLITYNVTEDASDFELRVNFTGITEFTTLLVRHKTEDDYEGHVTAIQIWDYNSDLWEGYGYLTESTTSDMKTLGVYDDTDHIGTGENLGVVQVRFYLDGEPPPKTHIHQFDWVILSKGFGTPVGQEIDPKFNEWLGEPKFVNNVNMSGNNITNVDKIYVDNIAEKTAGHNIVVDNTLEMIGVNGVITSWWFADNTKQDGVNIQNDRFLPLKDGTLGGLDLGDTGAEWNNLFITGDIGENIAVGTPASNLWLSGDANIGGDALVTGFVNATGFNGTYYGDGQYLKGIIAGNSSWNESRAFELFLNRTSESIYLSTYNATYDSKYGNLDNVSLSQVNSTESIVKGNLTIYSPDESETFKIWVTNDGITHLRT